MFSHGQTPTQFLIFAIIFLIFWNLEIYFGVTQGYNKFKHDLKNAFFILPGAVVQFLVGLILLLAINYVNVNKLGLIPFLNISSTWLQICIIFIVFDFFYYLYHVVMHKYKAVWSFHAVHHSDKVLNVSTSLREHPIETVIRTSQFALIAILVGAPLWVITLHQFIQIISKIVIHANIRLPEKIDNIVSWVFITPNMHHVHHHSLQPYTDSNYGDLFSIWDRIFGTYRHLLREDVNFGLDETNDLDLEFLDLIKLPIKR